MQRLMTILAGYISAACSGMVVLVIFGWIDAGSLSLDRIGYVAPIFLAGAVMGAAYSVPVALPTILFTKISRFHSAWLFAVAGLATAALILMLISDFTLAEINAFEPYVVRDIVVVSAVSITASLTYWLIAWRLFPPKRLQSEPGAITQ